MAPLKIPPVVLPRFSEELEAGKRISSPRRAHSYSMQGQLQGDQQPQDQETAPQILGSKVGLSL